MRHDIFVPLVCYQISPHQPFFSSVIGLLASLSVCCKSPLFSLERVLQFIGSLLLTLKPII